MNESIFFGGLKEIDVLVALYNAAIPIKAPAAQVLNNHEQIQAEQLMAKNNRQFGIIDLGKGPRALYVNLSGEEFNPKRYDEENGVGKAASVMSDLRSHMRAQEDLFRATPPMLPSSPIRSPMMTPFNSPVLSSEPKPLALNHTTFSLNCL